MAKQKEITGDFNFGFDNIEKATEVFSNQEKENNKNFQINFKTHKEWIVRFHSLHMSFLLANVDYELYGTLKDFFKLIIEEYSFDLKSKNQFKEAPKNFIHHISKRGRRAQTGERTVNAKDRKSIVFGEYNTDEGVREKLHDIMYSLALLEENKNFSQYTISYFFYDMLIWGEENLNNLKDKYSNK